MLIIDIFKNQLKELFRIRPIADIIKEDLHQAKLDRLRAEADLEYSNSVVMYNTQRIARLEKRLTEAKNERI